MIIMGYPGIGKSTVAKQGLFAPIDLESSNFMYNGKKIDNWAEIYVNVAIDISSQSNRDVFVSSHADVQKELIKRKNEDPLYHEDLCCAIVPAYKIKDQWIQKLKDRYESTKLDKDLRAYVRAKEYFVYDIADIIGNDDIICIEIQDINNYDLMDLIHQLRVKATKNYR